MRTLVVVAIILCAASFASAAELKLWYAQPAPLEPNWKYSDKPNAQTKGWVEALPVGNGRLGAMVFGGVAEERIQFNEDTLWTGKPHDYVRAGSGEVLGEIRKAAFEGRDVGDLIRKRFLSDPVRQKAYQPFGDLRFLFADHGDGKPAEYRRELDFDTAVATVRYKIGDVTYTREVFASLPANAIVVRLSADKPGKVAFQLRQDSPHKNHATKAIGKDTIQLTGHVVDPKA